jgi:hypothetical protein
MSSLRVLAETMASSGDPLTAEEKQRFAAAAKIATRTIEDNSDDPYDVKDEADQLEALTTAYSMDLDALVASLRSHADDVAERQSGGDSSDDPEGRYKASTNEQQKIDLDSVFAGLLDR